MGSFNTTCFASRQTIATHDRCVVVPILQQSTYAPIEGTFADQPFSLYGVCNSTCYPTRFWAPEGPFLEAKYDDYGRFELEDTPLNRWKLMTYISDLLAEPLVIHQGENTSHDVPFNLREFMSKETPKLLAWFDNQLEKDDPARNADLLFADGVKCWDYFYEAVQEQRMVGGQRYPRLLRPLSVAVMHRDAFDELVNRTAAAKSWSGESFEMRAFFDRCMAEAVEHAEKFKADMPSLKTEEQKASFRQWMVHDRFRDALRQVGGSDRNSFYGESDALTLQLERRAKGELTDDQLFEKVVPWLQVRYACSSLEALNLHFEPVVYASQDYDNSIGKAYASFVSNVSAKATRARIVSCYGEFTRYKVSVPLGSGTSAMDTVFAELKKFVRESDAHLELLDATFNTDKSEYEVNFECTLELDDMREVLENFIEQHPQSPIRGATLACAD